MTVEDSPRTVVKSLGQASAALALGSCFFHSSHTRLGQKTDGLLIGVMSLILHQASLSGLPEALKTPELVDLGPSRRSRTGVQIAQVNTDWQQARSQDNWSLSPLPYVSQPQCNPTSMSLHQEVTDMYSSQPPTQWRATLDAIDLPRYTVSTPSTLFE